MAKNKTTVDDRRVGAVKARSQLKNPLTGTWTKRDDRSGLFLDVKAKPFKGVRKQKERTKKVEEQSGRETAFRFAKHSEECEPAKDQERLNCLAACIANQQAAGFKNYLDVREQNCGTCGASGFNTGWGFWEFVCGMTVLSDGEGGDPCPKEAAE